jgi:hypothetical protein
LDAEEVERYLFDRGLHIQTEADVVFLPASTAYFNTTSLILLMSFGVGRSWRRVLANFSGVGSYSCLSLREDTNVAIWNF